MDPIIKKYLLNDAVFNQMNREFISLDSNQIKNINQHLEKAVNELIRIMKLQNLLFKKTFKRIAWTGSFYKKTKVGLPDEFDLNIIIQLPIKEENMQFDASQPGYIKICTNINKNDTYNLDVEARKNMNSFIDDGSYLNEEKFRRWFESILNKVAHSTNQNQSIIKLENYIVKVRKSGPAFTLSLSTSDGRYLADIDFVPVIAFSCRVPPSTRRDVSKFKKRDWYVVPKPFNNKNVFGAEQYHYWRVSYYEFEKDILRQYGRVKDIIRFLKKLRDTQGWKSIASYYIETLCLHHLDIFETHKQSSCTFLFFMMLNKLHEAFRHRRINHYWNQDVDLLKNIEYNEITNMEYRLQHIIEHIKQKIMKQSNPSTNPYVIAEYILNQNEMTRLQRINSANPEQMLQEREQDPESGSSLVTNQPESQRGCVIV